AARKRPSYRYQFVRGRLRRGLPSKLGWFQTELVKGSCIQPWLRHPERCQEGPNWQTPGDYRWLSSYPQRRYPQKYPQPRDLCSIYCITLRFILRFRLVKVIFRLHFAAGGVIGNAHCSLNLTLGAAEILLLSPQNCRWCWQTQHFLFCPALTT